MADKTLLCKDCQENFQFSEGEQKFYADKGFPEPIRCPGCRKIKKDNNKNKTVLQINNAP